MIELFTEMVPEHSVAIIGVAALLFASFTSLFSVVNPLAAMPIFLSLTERLDEKERIRTAKRASIYMFGVLISFLLIGTFILSFF